MPRSRSPRGPRTPAGRVRFVLAVAAAACAVLTAVALLVVPGLGAPADGADGQVLDPVLAAQSGPAGRHGDPAPNRRGRPPTPAPTPPDAPPDANCTLVVPPAPLSAAGLATPYRLAATDPAAGPCHEADPAQSAFVEAAILDPATGAVSVYHPLVIDDGTQPAIAPVHPTLPAHAVVGVWFGYQADVLQLRQRRGHHGVMDVRYRPTDGCVNGLPGSPFGQFAYCGAPQFFAAANAAIHAGKLAVPDLGTGRDGLPCPTTRDFGVVDQDQSDNLPTAYLATSDGRTAQFSAANSAALPGASVLTNASDNGLVDDKLDPVLGCEPATAPDLSAGGSPSPALALNELQAAAHQPDPVALVPPNDPMAQADGRTSVVKTNLYRVGVDQPPVDRATDTGAAYCANLAEVGVARIAKDAPFTGAAPSPDPGVAADLHGFLVSRLDQSWTDLGCQALTGRPSPVTPAAPTTSPPATTTSPPATADPGTTSAPKAPAGTTTMPTTAGTPPPARSGSPRPYVNSHG